MAYDSVGNLTATPPQLRREFDHDPCTRRTSAGMIRLTLVRNHHAYNDAVN
jgi:hypothetical protein